MAARLDMWPGEVYDMMLGSHKIGYRVYPSLLDKYQQMLDYQEEAEKPWNKWSETSIARAKAEHQKMVSNPEHFPMVWHEPTPGDYILTPEEMYEKLEQELIDTINREPHEPSEAADKGTSLNEVVDCLILNKPCDRQDMTIESQCVGGEAISILVNYDGFSFNFDIELCRNLRDLLKGSVCQYCISAPIKTRYGEVLLYGYMDYWRGAKIIDLKTTSRYDFGNYERKWQRWVYPYCAIESGQTDRVDDFTFLVAQLGKGKLIGGNIYPEVYGYDHEQAKEKLRGILESFIEWLEAHKELISDRKIFNDLSL